jgi:hypothetical protein
MQEFRNHPKYEFHIKCVSEFNKLNIKLLYLK